MFIGEIFYKISCSKIIYEIIKISVNCVTVLKWNLLENTFFSVGWCKNLTDRFLEQNIRDTKTKLMAHVVAISINDWDIFVL